MCIPMSNSAAAGVGAGTTAFGAGVSALGNYMQGQIEAGRLEFNAKIAEENAALADLAAKDITKKGKIDTRIYRRRVKAFIGEQRATYGASGVDVTAGAPADVIEDTYLAGEADAMAIRRNASLEAWGLKSRAAGFRSEAGMMRVGAANAESAASLAAGTTLMTGAGSIGLQYYQYKNIGVNTWKKTKLKNVTRMTTKSGTRLTRTILK